MLAGLLLGVLSTSTQADWVVYQGRTGPGKQKHLVFLAGDEEYRSEEGLPQLAKILAVRHGFRCTVLFPMNDRGEIDPEARQNQPGLEVLKTADACIMLLRFRAWPETQMKHFSDYLASGRPIIALRTSTHAFDYPADSNSPYAKFGWRSEAWPGGFGKQVLGENWISHWGIHGKQATLGIPEKLDHPTLKGVGPMFGDSDVYEVHPPSDATVLARGRVLAGMKATDPPADGQKKTVKGAEQRLNEPMMPVAWVRQYGQTKVVVTTMGAATDLLDPDLRRFLVHSVYWTTGLSAHITDRLDVTLVGPYKPSPFGFGGFKKGVKPSDLALD